MPVCVPGSLPGFVDTVTTVAGRGSPAEWREPELRPSRSPASSTRPLLRRALALGPERISSHDKDSGRRRWGQPTSGRGPGYAHLTTRRLRSSGGGEFLR